MKPKINAWKSIKFCLTYPYVFSPHIFMSYHISCAKVFCMINCFSILFDSIYLGDIPLKHIASDKVNPLLIIPSINQAFKTVLKRPAHRNLILVILACIHAKTLKINVFARHLPVFVAHYKTKQKRLLRFIDSNFPTPIAMEAWCAFVLRQLCDKTRRVPFRKRAIPIYWKIYEKDAFKRMVYPSYNVLVQEFCDQFIKQFETAFPNVRKPIFVFDRGFARARYL